MRLTKPFYEILTKIEPEVWLKDLERIARTCYQSEGKITEDSYKTLVAKLIKNGHEAMIEHGHLLAVKFVMDRGVSIELVRHRMASFAQESTRYCAYRDHVEYIIPPQFRNIPEGVYDGLFTSCFAPEQFWINELILNEKAYKEALRRDWPPQEARQLLNHALKTEIVVSANLREWRHIFKMRTPKTAHPHMIDLMRPLLANLQGILPIIFDDIEVPHD